MIRSTHVSVEVDLSNSRSSSFILEGAGDPSAVRTRRTLSACRSRVSIAMTGRTASAPRGVGRRRRERRPFLAATLGSALSTLLLVLLLLHAPAPARAHEDSSEPGHASADGTDGYVFEYHERPPPPPPAQPAHYVGGVYAHGQTWHGEIEVVCTVVIKPGAYLAITPGATISFRSDCDAEDAKLWGLTNPGGVNVSKPSIVVMKGAKLYAVGTAEEPIVFRPKNPDALDVHTGRYTRGAWGGVVVLGDARVGWNDADDAQLSSIDGTVIDKTNDADFAVRFF